MPLDICRYMPLVKTAPNLFLDFFSDGGFQLCLVTTFTPSKPIQINKRGDMIEVVIEIAHFLTQSIDVYTAMKIDGSHVECPALKRGGDNPLDEFFFGLPFPQQLQSVSWSAAKQVLHPEITGGVAIIQPLLELGLINAPGFCFPINQIQCRYGVQPQFTDKLRRLGCQNDLPLMADLSNHRSNNCHGGPGEAPVPVHPAK